VDILQWILFRAQVGRRSKCFQDLKQKTNKQTNKQTNIVIIMLRVERYVANFMKQDAPQARRIQKMRRRPDFWLNPDE